ncbi:unnamed protein product [Orchesella dallaii]|uniref:GTPase-activating protein and VPS9 domain-containing protein 1 n=1 Tax=Orchesella dallaii TaxID=48710 RepID=A0ABP1S4T6_9HEXA
MPSSNFDLIDLCRRLKQEKLFVANERKEIEGLNRKVQLLSTGLLHQTWLTGQHRLALENMSNGPVTSPFTTPFIVSPADGSGDVTENLELVQAHKLISGRYLHNYIDLITLLRNHPELVALCLSLYEKDRGSQQRMSGTPNVGFGDILQGVINIYGGIGGPLPGDGTSHLKLLSALAGHQLVGAESPRRVLRQGSCAFSFLYRLISETTPSSRLFLVGALHQPVTELLSSPNLLCLGTNIPATSPTASMDTTGCLPNNSQNKDILSLDRTEKMAELTKMFIDSILDNINSFPPGLAWLIKSVHVQLSPNYPEKEVSTICTDLIWALFICPAVTNPEPFGVTDAPVGSQARHTLSQVATNLQALALHRWEGTDPRLQEYIAYLDPESLTAVLDHVLTIDSLPGEQSGVVASLSRRTLLIPENLMHALFAWLKHCLPLVEQQGKLKNLEVWTALEKLTLSVNESLNSLASAPKTSNSTPTSSVSGSNPSLSSSGSPSHGARLLESGRKALLNRRGDARVSSNQQLSDARSDSPLSVVVFPTTQSAWEWVGMLPESEVVSASKNGKIANSVPDVDGLPADDPEEEEREERSSLGEKRTRFSLSHDDGSIGTSDNLEAVSEAASTHSVSSSIELEDQNDNLSDMLSANVSGRGTPNVSGRNTPLSQAEQEENENDAELDDDIIMNEVPNEPPPNNLNPPNLNNLNLNGPDKQARSEIEDKFCKFEIKKQFEGDETVSLVSDTWSTDVLASDSEMGGDIQQAFNLPFNQINPVPRQQPPPVPIVPAQPAELPPAAQPTQDNQYNETMSEAWSTDVAASDIGRLNDFDTDDASSVARSDDTGRSEIDGMAYDTPRSSVSGGVAYRPRSSRDRDNEPDLLMFDDVPRRDEPMNVVEAQCNPVAPVDAAPVPMEMSVEASVPSSSAASSLTPSTSQGSLMNDNPGPSTSAQLPVAGSSNTLLAPGSSNRSGAIPKTISFDKTAERGDRENWDEENGRNSTKRFFRNFRLPFRGRNRKPNSRGVEDRLIDWDRMPENPSLPVPKLRKSLSEDPTNPVPVETSDDILAKYRRKPSLTDASVDTASANNASRDQASSSKSSSVAGTSSTAVVRKDSLKMSRSEIIVDARKKLRNVLSNCDLQVQAMDGSSIDVALTNLLRIEMASAISRADQVTAAHLQDAVRTVKQLGGDGCRKVMRLMRDDYRRRSDYISYLMRAKQGLLSTIQFLERATVRAKYEGDTYSHYLINECIRIWLEEPNQSQYVEQFTIEFCQATAIDEKIELLEGFLSTLTDMFVGTKELSEWQLGKTENALEQYIVSRVYVFALYPNGDGDKDRDRLLRDHIAKIDLVITPSHRDLRIPKSRLGECPWPPAQRELKMLSAYKTPSDKLKCIIKACSVIVNLLSSSSEKVVAADDFVPVLVFVLIKSNPPALLSTIQYVNSYCGQRITGEEGYWWTQFCSAVEFIKTMDYTE